MCIVDLKPTPEELQQGIGYKVMQPSLVENGYFAEFGKDLGEWGSLPYEVGEEYEAQPYIDTIDGVPTPRCGFHVFLKKEDAEHWYALEGTVIVKVQYRVAREMGVQPFLGRVLSVVLAKYVTILEEVEPDDVE